MLVLQSANHLFRAHKVQYGTNPNGDPEYIAILMARTHDALCTHAHWYCSKGSARKFLSVLGRSKKEADVNLFNFLCNGTKKCEKTGVTTGIRTMSFESAADFPGVQKPHEPVFSPEKEIRLHWATKRYPVDFYREDTGPRPARKPEDVTNALLKREEKSKIFRQQRTYADGNEVIALVKRAVEAGEYTVPIQGVEREVAEPYEPPSWAFKSDHFDPQEAKMWEDLFTDDALRALR